MDFGSAGNFEQAPTGIHKAKLFSILDLGTQRGEYKGEPTKNRQLHFTWELVNKTKTDGKPYTISRFYNQSLGENSNFIKDLTSWFGAAPAVPSKPEEKKAFVDELLHSLIGKGCQLVIIADSNGKHKISTITGLGEDDVLPDGLVNETVYLDLDEFNEDTYEKVPKGMQGIIQKSPEYAKLVGGTVDTPEEMETDIPF